MPTDLNHSYEIAVAGHGGQGVVLMSYLLAYIGLEQGYEVTWFPSYGAEMRGGTANCAVKISADAIASPLLDKPTHALVLNNPSYLKFEDRMQPNGIMLVNKTLVKATTTRSDIKVIRIPAGEIAENLGNIRVSNMVILGGFLASTELIPLDKLEPIVKNVIPKRHHQLIPLNLRAIKEGTEFVHSQS